MMEQQGGRRSRRAELLELRALVAELEQKLRELQRQKLVLEPTPGLAGPCECLEIEEEEEEEATSAAAALWARTARAQKDQRVRAEVENARLRESLEGQLKVARSLDRLLRKRPLQETEDAGQVSRRRPVGSGRENEGAVFEELLGRIDGLYAQLDAIWLETGLEINQRERKDAEAKVDADGDIFLEIVNAKIVPFSVDRVSKTVWQLSSMEMQVSNGHLATIESTEDTIKTQFFLTLSLRRTQTPIQMNVVIKRFVNDSDRVVLVWTSEGRPLDTSLGEQDILISGYGWAVIEKHVMTSMGMEDIKSESSIIQMCVRIVPRFSDSSQQRTRSGLLTDMIVGSYTANVTHLIQHAENMLLNEG